MGIEKPSKIQQLAIPKLIQSQSNMYSLIASQGAGKTLAYLLPVLKRIDAAKGKTQAICLVHSCELAHQMANVAARVTMYLNKHIHIGLAIQNNKGIVYTS